MVVSGCSFRMHFSFLFQPFPFPVCLFTLLIVLFFSIAFFSLFFLFFVLFSHFLHSSFSLRFLLYAFSSLLFFHCTPSSLSTLFFTHLLQGVLVSFVTLSFLGHAWISNKEFSSSIGGLFWFIYFLCLLGFFKILHYGCFFGIAIIVELTKLRQTCIAM